MKNGFIEQTANDYDMTYIEVECIYKNCKHKRFFYEELEQFIKDRSK